MSEKIYMIYLKQIQIIKRVRDLFLVKYILKYIMSEIVFLNKQTLKKVFVYYILSTYVTLDHKTSLIVRFIQYLKAE